jgi:leucyl aminopeptidase
VPIEITTAGEAPEEALPRGFLVFDGADAVAPVELSEAHHWRRRGFRAKVGETLVLERDGGALEVLVGAGARNKCTLDDVRRVGGAFARAVSDCESAVFDLRGIEGGGLTARAAAGAWAEGVLLAEHRFSRYKTDHEPRALKSVTLVADDVGNSTAAVARATVVASAVNIARDLINEPPTTMTPSRLADVAVAIALRHGLAIEVFDQDRIVAERLGGLLGVARGSAEPPRLVKMVYEPDPAVALPVGGRVPTVALVGKGITFDSGGLSLKTADGMTTMKTDMSGAAAVIATLGSCRDLNVPVRVVGITPISENMPGGRATKPGDVLRIRNGKTIEVLNTDAEGRLVLADGLCLATEERPDAIIDLATLTGACVVALGRRIAGLMGNDDRLIAQVSAASARAGESTWHLPLPDEYKSHIESEIADMKNIGSPGQAGALSAGLLLAEFVGDTPWAHLDIAGPARSEEDRDYLHKGATGFGVRTLIELLGRFEPVRSDADRQARHAAQGDASVEGEHAPGAGGDSHPGQPDPPSTSGPYGLRGDARGDSHPQAF